MHIRSTTFNGRKVWEMDNGCLTLAMTVGGGHIARLALNDKPDVNPLWEPVWRTVEPWQFRPGRDEGRYANRLLASICGHNLCVPWFGGASPEETAAGMDIHGEAGVSRWRLLRRKVTARAVTLTAGCDMPACGMRVTRTLTARAGASRIGVVETLRNLTPRDVPYTMCEHVTIGAPFLEKGVTVLDAPATRGHTYPRFFEPKNRLKMDTAFRWPDGPGTKGETVDLRMIHPRYRRSSDFCTLQMDPRRDDAWFAVTNPRQGVLMAYVWDRRDFPWLGNWEENFGRPSAPWAGKSLTRGLEFANTPFPMPLRDAMARATFHGLPTYRWLPARSACRVAYDILMLPVDATVRGVADIRRDGAELRVALR